MKRLLIIVALIITISSTAVAESGYKITAEYKWDNGRSYHNDVVIKNTSGYDAKINVMALFKDKDGNVIGVFNREERGCEDGYETFWSLYQEQPFDACEIVLSMRPDDIYKGVQSNIDHDVLIAGNKAVISAKNTSTDAVGFVEYWIIFFGSDNNVVDCGWGFTIDGDNEIKPGDTRYAESLTSHEFVKAEAYLKGNNSKYK